ncbi:tetratricopeptide repeat protein [Herbaspirillum sp. ST 5-3]|uniref:tetratricopeptide repeat protein n=1 Tax=Oxalobacteraceae TaxID=75682 RepID=UPI0010A49B15|nr:tetratricopeptide repeat protein [Herbaspirillum sp. ST 5-3]
MSLINQMLQELDARRSETTGSSPFGQQVRAVPEQRGIHPAWWVALALAGVLSGVLAWVFLQPPTAAPSQAVSLPLKLDSDLDTVFVSSQSPSAGQITNQAIQAVAAEQGSSEPNVQEEPPKEPARSPTAIVPVSSPAEKRAPALKPVVPVESSKSVSMNVVPELAKVVPAAKKLAETSIAKPAGPEAPIAISKQFKELTPQQRAENEYRKAIAAVQQGKTADAIAGLEQALQLDAQHVAARQALIGVYLESKRQDDALNKAREGLTLDPAQPGLAMIAARLQLEKGALRPAIETLERTLPFAADHGDYQAFLAALLQRDERHKQAVEHYLQAVQRSPRNGVWWMGLGISLQAEQRFADAQEAFKRAKASNSLTPELEAFVEGRLSQLKH